MNYKTIYDRLFLRFLIVFAASCEILEAHPETHGFASIPMATGSSAANFYFQYEFEQPTLLENRWSAIPGGFQLGTPAGRVAFAAFNSGEMPSSNDKLGMQVQVQGKQVAFLLAMNPIQNQGKPVLLRLIARANGLDAQLALVALKGDLQTGENMDGSIATHIPANSSKMIESEYCLTLLYQPDSGTDITPAIQVAGTGGFGVTTVWIDRLEVYLVEDALFASKSLTFPATPAPSGISVTIPLPNLPEGAKPLEMVLIKTGMFVMGAPYSERGRSNDYDWPPHEVTISKDFYLGKYELTQAQWQAVMGSNPSNFQGNPNNPVENLLWSDCQEFIEKLNQLGQGIFRLPTEAEWEYACRAGTRTRFSYGDILETDDQREFSPIHDQYMWWCTNSSDQPHEVGLKLPNPWGLYDMHGNVWEWCSDWWEAPYARWPQVDPQGPETGTSIVIRGGSWFDYSSSCRSAFHYTVSEGKYYNIGFRVCRIP
ncbi:MAG: formylglycine-generating enzyme family protein [Candidatus Omnitrophota bacterium]